MHRKLVLVLWLALALTIFTAGCSTGNTNNEVIIENGVIDTDYMGDPTPQLVVEMKLTPAEQAGNFERIPAKTKASLAELEKELQEEENARQEVGETDAPRPKI